MCSQPQSWYGPMPSSLLQFLLSLSLSCSSSHSGSCNYLIYPSDDSPLVPRHIRASLLLYLGISGVCIPQAIPFLPNRMASSSQFRGRKKKKHFRLSSKLARVHCCFYGEKRVIKPSSVLVGLDGSCESSHCHLCTSLGFAGNPENSWGSRYSKSLINGARKISSKLHREGSSVWDRECGIAQLWIRKICRNILFPKSDLWVLSWPYIMFAWSSLLILLGNLDLKSSFILK